MTYTYSKLGVNGACGNQLWQIAGTIGAAKEAGDDIKLPDWYYRKFFSIPDEYFGEAPADSVDLCPDYLQHLSPWYGYDDVPDALLFSSLAWDLLYSNHAEVLDTTEQLVAVHVRRANNLKLPDHHPVCPIGYFERAIDLAGDGQLVVFSDDLEWCKKQSLFKDAYFAKGNDPAIDVMELTNGTPLSLDSVMLDLIFMANCDKHIISNSSFSWWGAFLSYGPEVYYPSRWYGKALQHVDISDMFPSFWHEVEV